MVRNETVKEMSVAPTKRPGSFIWKVNTEAGNKYQFFATTSDKAETILATVEPGTHGLFIFTEETYTNQQTGLPGTSRVLSGIQDPAVDVNADMATQTVSPTSTPPSPQTTWGTPANDDPSSTSKKLSDMLLCNVTNNASLIYSELIKRADLADEVTHDVWESLCNTIAKWHRKNLG